MKSNCAIALIVAAMSLAPHLAQSQTAYSKVVSNDAPILYWNFDEGSGAARELMPITLPSTVNDLIPMGIGIRLSHAAMGSGLNLGNAASFFLGEYFMVQNIAAATNSIVGPWAIEFWMRVQGNLEFQRKNYLISFGPAGGLTPAVIYDHPNGGQPRFGLEIYHAGTRTAAGPQIADQNWFHIMFVFYGDGSVGVADRVDIYVDGLVTVSNVRGTFSSPVSLARLVVGTSAPHFSGLDGFEGEIDEIALYDLTGFTTEAEITTKMDQVASSHYALAHSTESYLQGVLADQPFLYWNFDEESGSAHQLAPLQLPVVKNDLIPFGEAERVSHAGIDSGLGLGQAAHVSTGGYYANPQLVFTNDSIPAPWMIELWVQVQGDLINHPRSDYLMNFGNNAPAVLYDYNGGANPTGGLEVFHAGARTGFGPGIVDTGWHHLLFVYYGDGFTGLADRFDIYLDGANAAQYIRNTFAAPLALGSFVLGSSGAQFALADGFDGNLDEVAIYDLGALQTEEAVTTMAADFAARHYAAAQQPALQVVGSGNTLVISWNALASNFHLESTLSLSSPSWTPVVATPTVTDGRAQVTITPSSAQFFRLKR